MLWRVLRMVWVVYMLRRLLLLRVLERVYNAAHAGQREGWTRRHAGVRRSIHVGPLVGLRVHILGTRIH